MHYMGYFSSHEQIMQQILKEHSTWAEKFIKTTVEAAAVDCRRDLLWQRLQLGGRKQIKPRTEMDELTYRETVRGVVYSITRPVVTSVSILNS